MRHRAAEVRAIVAILESEDYESSEDMAKAVIEASVKLVQGRKLFGLRYAGIPFGPWLFESDAKRASGLLQGIPSVRDLFSVQSFMDMANKFNAVPDPRYCPGCKHPRFAHGFVNHVGCIVGGCKCLIIYK